MVWPPQFSNDGRQYNPWELRSQRNTKIAYNEDDLRNQLTLAYQNPNSVSTIKLGDNILLTKSLTIDTQGDFSGIIIDGSNQFNIYNTTSLNSIFNINVKCTLSNLVINAYNTTYVFNIQSNIECVIDGATITTTGIDGYIFNVSGDRSKSLFRNITVDNTNGTLSAVFGATESIGWTVHDLRLIGATDLLWDGTAAGSTYTYCNFSNIRALAATGSAPGASGSCRMSASCKGCHFQNLFNIIPFDPGTLATGNTMISMFVDGPGAGAFNIESGNVAVDISGYATNTLNTGSTLLGMAGNHPAIFPNKVGIGTISPSVDLEIVGEVKLGSDGTAAATAGAGSLRYNGALQLSDGSNWKTIPIDGDFATRSLNNISNTTASASIIPAIDDGYSLGSVTKRWHDGYFSPSSLHIYGTSAEVGSITDWEFGIRRAAGTGQSSLLVNKNGTEVLIIPTAGALAINRYDALGLFEVWRKTTGAATMVLGTEGTGVISANLGYISFVGYNGTGTPAERAQIAANYDDNAGQTALRFYTSKENVASSINMTISGDGYVGIGSSSPVVSLHNNGGTLFASRSITLDTASPNLDIQNNTFISLTLGASSSGNITVNKGLLTGQFCIIRIVSKSGTATFPDNTAQNLKLSAAFSPTADDTLTLIYDGTNWLEVARSVN